jgi:DNA helicase-2/ATP-dependent DNA helicase PcrA
MELPPTPDQEKIIEFGGNSVVIARPGTGKTLTLAYKIRKILLDLPYYKGVIAISFTNKASDELEHRSLATGVERKNSFFGTIDKYFLAEIIMPFGDRVFGKPVQELSVVEFAELDSSKFNNYQQEKGDFGNIDFFTAVFKGGWIILEKIGFLALYVFEQSVACQRYMKARFSHVIIDEYQDCGDWQHRLFMKLVKLGLTGIAVGDIDQSIFVFAGKSSKYLSYLATQTDTYRTFQLVENHRCHPSIVNYSSRLLSKTFEVQPVSEIRVYEKRVNGADKETAQWLSSFIPAFSKQFGVTNLNRVGVLFSNRVTGNLIHQNMFIPHKPLAITPLDEDSSLWGSVFRRVLNWAYSPDLTKYELVEQFLNIDFQKKFVWVVMNILYDLENEIALEHNLSDQTDSFFKIAETLFPSARNQRAMNNLTTILTTPIYLSSFIPAKDDEVQLLTLHKSKGLEFDIVFHLNLHRWILPKYKGDYYQDLNLHYVGITRAKKCCVLCTSSQRQQGLDGVKDAEPSEFLSMNELQKLRLAL